MINKHTNNIFLNKNQKENKIKKRIQKENSFPLLNISHSSISLFSYEQMEKISPVVIQNKNIKDSYNSVNDPRLGETSPIKECSYCGIIDCPGHFGLIKFNTAIYNPLYIRAIVQVLTCVCNDCGSLLISEEVYKEKKFGNITFMKRLAALEKQCEDMVCLRSSKNDDENTIPCSKNPKFFPNNIRKNGYITYQLQENNKHFNNKKMPMPIERVIKILSIIKVPDMILLGFTKENPPINMILRGILVPPIIARPPVVSDDGVIRSDKLTEMYNSIILPKVLEANRTNNSDLIYEAFKNLIYKNEDNKSNITNFKTITELIQGKEAIIRAAIQGKSVNHCARTVIGPAPNLKFGQIRVPKNFAPILTKSIIVTDFNIKYLTKLLNEGKITNITSEEQRNKPYNKNITLLKVGNIVERWLQTGDRIINGRQPTLHKQSIMGYEVVLDNPLTIGLHLSYTTPMNADFDGDEDSLWNPQDYEVEAESEYLMNVTKNIISGENNKPSMGLVMNSITGIYLLTQDDTLINPDLFKELISLITNKDDINTLNFRLKKYNINPFSGKALFSAILPYNLYYEEGNVLILDGVLIEGIINKSNVGPTDKSLIQVIYKNYGVKRTVEFFSIAPIIINKWLIERGFTVGLLDCITLEKNEKGEEYDKNPEIIDSALQKLYKDVENLNIEDPLKKEHKINKLYDNFQNVTFNSLVGNLDKKNNSIYIMSEKASGAKGSIVNILQIMGYVGQQNYEGERLKPTIDNKSRLLPAYEPYSENPLAHGFVPESLFKGITPEGLFFIQAGGREGILDTALKTQETGSIQRNLMKAFENIIIAYDGSIRNTIGTLFSPIYNSGYDISAMIKVKNTLGKEKISSFIDLKKTITEINMNANWIKRENYNKIKNNNYEYENLNEVTNQFKNLKTYNEFKLTKYEKSRIIGARATQLSNNAKPLIDIMDENDPIKIAIMEYKAKVIPIYIIRKFPNKTYQKIYVNK